MTNTALDARIARQLLIDAACRADGGRERVIAAAAERGCSDDRFLSAARYLSDCGITWTDLAGGDLTDEQNELADHLVLELEAAPVAGLTPSAAARLVGCTTDEAARVLSWLVSRQFAHTSGNGAWTRYHAGRP